MVSVRLYRGIIRPARVDGAHGQPISHLSGRFLSLPVGTSNGTTEPLRSMLVQGQMNCFSGVAAVGKILEPDPDRIAIRHEHLFQGQWSGLHGIAGRLSYAYRRLTSQPQKDIRYCGLPRDIPPIRREAHGPLCPRIWRAPPPARGGKRRLDGRSRGRDGRQALAVGCLEASPVRLALVAAPPLASSSHTDVRVPLGRMARRKQQPQNRQGRSPARRIGGVPHVRACWSATAWHHTGRQVGQPYDGCGGLRLRVTASVDDGLASISHQRI